MRPAAVGQVNVNVFRAFLAMLRAGRLLAALGFVPKAASVVSRTPSPSVSRSAAVLMAGRWGKLAVAGCRGNLVTG